MGGVMTAAAAATQTEISPTFAAVVMLALLFWLYCGYRCATNNRWGLFMFGFLCGWLWLVGWLLGPKRPSYY